MTNHVTLAPIALFVYNRMWHTQQTIWALKNNALASQSDLIIFSDGPRTSVDVEKVRDLRTYLRTIDGFKSVKVIESEVNKGLANSIIGGVTHVLSIHENIIVMEDDLVTSPHFLTFMNNALSLYNADDDVVCIHGYFFPVKEHLPDTFFIKGADCWGWATWRRGWQCFDENAWRLLRRIVFSGRSREFDYDNSYAYTRMLFSQCIGRIDSWAIRWYASAFLNDRLTLYPASSLVRNIGMDSSGTHTRSWNKDAYDTTLTDRVIHLEKIPTVENVSARKARGNYLMQTRIPVLRKVLHKLKFLLNRWFGSK